MEQKTFTSPDVTPSFETLSAVEAMMLPGERLVHVTAISAGIYWKCFGMMLLAIISIFFSLTFSLYLAVIGLILGVLAFRTRRYLMLGATDQRIIASGGALTQEMVDVPYDSIESVELFTTPMGMLFGYASVIITGLGRKRMMIPYISDAGSFHDDVMKILLSHQQSSTRH